jgi:ferredoxin
MAMKTEIYYFSGSGNGFFLARGLKERLDAGTGGLSETAIVPLALERGRPRISSADRVGIVFPVYFLDLPNIVKEFIASLGVKKGAYVFTASSCGLDDSGVALKVRRLLARKGIELSAAFRFILPDNSIVFPTPKIRHEAMISKAIADLDCAAAAILSKKPIFQATGSRSAGIGGRIMKAYCDGVLGFKDLRADPAACTGCGICAKVCSVGNISLSGGKPQWGSRKECVSCFGCLHACPASAIRFRGQSKAKEFQYRNPRVKASDLFLRDHSTATTVS